MKARFAKKLLKRLAVTEVKPDDVVLFWYPAWYSMPAYDPAYDLKALQKAFPANKVIAVSDDTGLEIIRKGTP